MGWCGGGVVRSCTFFFFGIVALTLDIEFFCTQKDI